MGQTDIEADYSLQNSELNWSQIELWVKLTLIKQF